MIVGEQLYIYFGAFSGVSPKLGFHMYAGGSTGLATMRRDGFVSHAAGLDGGRLTTRKLNFGGSHLFVNSSSTAGELRAEVLDENGRVIEPFSCDRCNPITTDKTQQHVTWDNGRNLSQFVNQPVQLRFQLRNSALYSFWVSPDSSGASYGYVAAGGPGHTSAWDKVGQP